MLPPYCPFPELRACLLLEFRDYLVPELPGLPGLLILLSWFGRSRFLVGVTVAHVNLVEVTIGKA